MKFCLSFENLYGSERVTPIMHLHGHLLSCVKQYGPLYSFQLFSFEHYNGIIDNISNNKHNIETEFMKSFDRDNQMINLKYLAAGQAEIHDLFEKMLITNSQRGKLSDMFAKDYVLYFSIVSRNLIVKRRNSLIYKGLNYHSNRKCIALTKSSTHA